MIMPQKTARLRRAVLFYREPAAPGLLATTEAPGPPACLARGWSRLGGCRFRRRGPRSVLRGRWLRPWFAGRGRRRDRLGIYQEAHLFADGRSSPCRLFGLL